MWATETLIQFLTEAQRSGSRDVDAALYSGLDRAAAYRIQTGVLTSLRETVGMLKTAVHSDGVGVVAPIYATHVGSAPDYRVPAKLVTGLEVEVGVVFAKDVPMDAELDAGALAAAIDHYFLGVEICGTRFVDRSAAGANGGLADNMSALGYSIGAKRPLGDHIEGLLIELEFAGTAIYSAPAKHGFGTVLASLLAYARNQHDAYQLKAGTFVTTGSMCGLVPTSGDGHVVARLGGDSIEFDIV